MQYKPGDTVYIVTNNRYVKEMEILNISDVFFTLRFLDQNGYIRLRANRLFTTEEDAKDSLSKKAGP